MAGFIFCSSAHSIRESKPDQYLAKSANLRRMLQEGGGDAVEQAPSETPGIAAAPPAELVADRQRLQQEISARKNASTGISAEEEEGARMSAALEASERTKSQVHDDFSACSVTIACEPCPSEALRDQAEYCLKTGWRQVHPLPLTFPLPVRADSPPEHPCSRYGSFTVLKLIVAL